MELVDLMTEEQAPNTNFLKSVVIILAVLIVGVSAVIGVTVYKRAIQSDVAEEVQAIPTPFAQIQIRQFGDVILTAPEGLKVLFIQQNNGLMLVTYGTADGEPKQVVVVSPATGTQQGRFILNK
jgi:hypothetical protein